MQRNVAQLGAVLAVALAFAVTLIQAAEVARYDNYRLYQVTPQSAQQFEAIASMAAASDSLIFLETGRKVGDRFDVIVAPHRLADFTEALEMDYIPHRLIDADVQRSFDAERSRLMNKRAKGVFDWSEYHTLDEIHAWLNKLAREHPGKVTLLDAGRSHQNRTLKGVRVSYGEGRPGVFLEGGIHAREWISPATVTYILNELLTSEDPRVRATAEKFDWYVFPNVNPDGYEYTFRVNRLWRKTRKQYGVCFGADPNRNWDFHWAEQGTSTNACSDTFHGASAFSEVEMKSLSAFVNSLKGKVSAYLAFHSYSQLLLFPYGHTGEHSPNHQDLDEIAEATVKSLAKRYGTKYEYGNVYDAIYPASGSSVDWAYGVQGVKIAYTYELRPQSGSWNGFVLPPSQIVPTGEETLDSLVTLLEESSARGYYNQEE